MQRRLLIFVLALAAAIPVAAQTDTSQSSPQSSQPVMPAHVGSETPGLASQSDLEYKNVIVASFLGGAMYEDNAIAVAATGSTPAHFTGDKRFFAQPSIAYQRTHRNTRITVSYAPGIDGSIQNASGASYTHNLSADVQFSPFSRMIIHLRQDYSVSTNPFESVGKVSVLPSLGGYFGPNYDGVLPSTKRTSLISTAELSYVMTPRTSLGFTGGYQRFDYNPIVAPNSVTALTTLIGARDINASMFFTRQMTKRNSVGLQYAFMDIHSLPSARTQSHGLLLFDSWQLSRHTSLMVYGGAEFSRSHNVFPVQLGPFTLLASADTSGWRPTAGLAYQWSGERNAIQIQAVHRLSDGGGLMSTVSMTYGAIGWHTRLTRRWTMDTTFRVTDQEGLSLTNQSSAFRSYWGGLSLSRTVTRNFSIQFEYAHINQTGTGLTTSPTDHNLYQMGIQYYLVKPLGR